MNSRTYFKCFDICEEVMKNRAGRRIRNRDYPAAVVFCAPSVNNYSSAMWATSGKVSRNSYASTPSLEWELQRLGNIGSQGHGCDNRIGACAEPHAARKILLRYPQNSVSQLAFSLAFRPRTKLIVPYCLNCLSIFNVHNP